MRYLLADGTTLTDNLHDVYITDTESGEGVLGVVEDVDLNDGLVLIQVVDASWIKKHPHLAQSGGIVWVESSLVRPVHQPDA